MLHNILKDKLCSTIQKALLALTKSSQEIADVSRLDSKLLLANVAQRFPLPPQQERMLATTTSALFQRPRLKVISPLSQVAICEHPLPLVPIHAHGADPVEYFALYCKLQSKATAMAECFATEAISNTYNFYYNTNTSGFDHTHIGHVDKSRIFRAVLIHELRHNSSQQFATAFFSQIQEWEFEEIRSIIKWLKHLNKIGTHPISISLDTRLSAHFSNERTPYRSPA